jgi:uncharacterized protein YlxW (UPF0749 family)
MTHRHAQEAAVMLAAEKTGLEYRLAVLERSATDADRQLADEIDKLR